MTMFIERAAAIDDRNIAEHRDGGRA
ncbi:MAG: hypothetical protein V7632_4851, partial [Bradyrhizobium sp.]